MHCSHVKVGDTAAIICGPKRIRSCIVCRAPATRECDWRLDRVRYPRKSGSHTCDAGLCAQHTFSPAPDKDLCPNHVTLWENHPARAQVELQIAPAHAVLA